jgi:5-methylcytosine-specific restriction endonuclease McrA
MDDFPEFKLNLYSIGSHKPVRWTCPDCNEVTIKAFKQAVKTKRCKPCNNIVRPKKDCKGANNPFYGKKHVKGLHVGESNPMWKGGKSRLPKCKKCNKQLTDARAEACAKCWQVGSDNPNWNDSYNREQREHLRIADNYIHWAKAIKIRDNFTCQKCKQHGGQLHSHHIESFAKNKDKRYELSNGITLCKACHIKLHKSYGLITNYINLQAFLLDIE